MAQLFNQSQQKTIFSDLKIAQDFFSRSKGLIGTVDLAESEGLWILRCNSIHTCFMSFAIDCVFLNRELQVVRIVKSVKPWRMVLPIWKAQTVVEMKAGMVDLKNIKLGDQLHVVH